MIAEPEWPGWKDGGRRVEIGGKAGALVYRDMTPGPDEDPLYNVQFDDGTRTSFVDAICPSGSDDDVPWSYLDGSQASRG